MRSLATLTHRGYRGRSAPIFNRTRRHVRRGRGFFHGREPVDQSEKSFLADLRLETLWVSKFSALRKTADSSNRRFEVQRRPTGNRLRFQANLRGMY